MYGFILNKKVFFPEQIKISDEGKDFIRQLLRKEPEKRLGANSGGYVDVLKHPWLAELDEKKLRKQKEIKAPFIPNEQ